MKKDIVVLCQYFYPEHVSSATLATELAVGLKQKGLSVGVLCGYPKEYFNSRETVIQKKENFNGVEINRVKYTTFNNKSKFGRIMNFFSLFFSMVFRMRYLIKFKKIIVYSNPPILPLIPYFLNKVFKIEFYYVAFDIYPDNALKLGAIKENGLIHRLMNYINNKTYDKASKIILLGNEMKQYVIDNQIAKRETNLAVIPNWYSNENLLTNTELVNTQFIEMYNSNKFIILYSGNMGPFQDLDTILEGMLNYKNNDEILFIFTGHGSKHKDVEMFIKENQINNAKVFGFLTGTEYSDVLKISDICLVSLEKGIEGLGVPSKTYGYLAAGKPIIAIMSRNTDIANDVVERQCGINVVQGNIEGFIKAIDFYISNSGLKEEHSENAYKLYKEKYTKEHGITKYHKLLDVEL